MRVSVKKFKEKFRSEISIEQAFCQKVRKMGCTPIKLSAIGFRSWPDRLIVGPNRLFEFIEFKRPGQKLTDGQLEVHEKLASWGFDPKMFDDAALAAQYIHFKMNQE